MQVDAFGESLPTFNVDGKEKIHTICGGVATMLISMIVLAFAALKLEHLISRYNPNMSTFS